MELVFSGWDHLEYSHKAPRSRVRTRPPGHRRSSSGGIIGAAPPSKPPMPPRLTTRKPDGTQGVGMQRATLVRQLREENESAKVSEAQKLTVSRATRRRRRCWRAFGFTLSLLLLGGGIATIFWALSSPELASLPYIGTVRRVAALAGTVSTHPLPGCIRTREAACP